MIEKLSIKWVDWLMQNGADPENRDVLEYGAECAISELVANVVVFLFAFLLHSTLEMLVWQLFWLPLRLCIGGYHSPRNHLTCIIISTGLAIGCVLLAPLVISIEWFIWPVLVICGIIVFVVAPVLHPNHPISENRKSKMKRNGRVIFIFEAAIILFFNFINMPLLASVAGTGMLAAVLLCLIGKFTNANHKL